LQGRCRPVGPAAHTLFKKVRPRIELGPPLYKRGMQPAHPRTIAYFTVIKSSRRESNPRFLFVREASLAVGPRDVTIRVDRRGVEPRFPGCRPGVVPLDQQPIFSSSTGGSRTHRHQSLELIAMPIRVPCHRSHHMTVCCSLHRLRARESNRGVRAYETRPSTGPPACPRPRYRTGRAGFMRAGWTPVTPGKIVHSEQPRRESNPLFHLERVAS
jgi:hypothetical protein